MYLSLLVAVIFLQSCTAGGGAAPSVLTPVKEIINDLIGSEPPEVKKAQEQVVVIKNTLNSDIDYQITIEDQNLLTEESLLDDESEIKTWVK